MKDAENLASMLTELPAGSNVAVVTLLGSLCPITVGHVQTFVEARELLLNSNERTTTAQRPHGLERFDAMLGFVSLNSDSYVEKKLAAKGEPSLNVQQRQHLVSLALADHIWLGQEDVATWRDEGACVAKLRSLHPRLNFVHFYMNGADDVRRRRKWRWTNAATRFITMGRPGDTEAVIEAAQQDGVDLQAGYFVMGPELPDVSSSAVRAALSRGDVDGAARMLHPAVLAWLLEQGPWLSKPLSKVKGRRHGA